MPAPRQGRGEPPGPQPRSRVWPAQRASSSRSASSASRRHRWTGSGSGRSPSRTTEHGCPRSASAKTSENDARSERGLGSSGRLSRRLMRTPVPTPRRTATPGASRATASASATSSTSRSVAVVPTSRPAAVSAPGCRRRSSRVDIAHVAKHRRPDRVAQSEHPPATVLGRPEDRVVDAQPRGRGAQQLRRELRGVHADLHDRARHPRVRVGQPRAEVDAALRVDRPPVSAARSSRPRTARSRSPSSETWQRPAPTAAVAAASVSSSAAAATSAAARHADLGPEPGLHPAHLGRLRDDEHRRSSREHPPEVARGARRPAHRSGHLRPGAEGARAVADVALGEPPPGQRWPSGAARPGSRTDGPARRAPSSSVRRHTRIGAMSWAASRSADAATTTTRSLPSRACHGQMPRATGRRRPTAMSARPERTSSSSGRQVARVERAVAVHERDVVAGRGQQPGVHRRAVPRRRLVHDGRAAAAGHLGGVVARPVVDHDRPRTRPGTSGSRSTQAAASSRQGSTRSHRVSTSATVGRSEVPDTVLPPYELVTPSCGLAGRSRT